MPRRRPTLPATVLIAALAAPALADDTAAGYVEVHDDSTMVEAYGITAGELDDLDVYSADGAKIGEVEDVLADSTGKVIAVAVEFDAFAGIADEEVIVGLDALTLEGNRLITDLDETQASSLPRWH